EGRDGAAHGAEPRSDGRRVKRTVVTRSKKQIGSSIVAGQKPATIVFSSPNRFATRCRSQNIVIPASAAQRRAGRGPRLARVRALIDSQNQRSDSSALANARATGFPSCALKRAPGMARLVREVHVR